MEHNRLIMSLSSAAKLLWTLLLAVPLITARSATPEATITAFVGAWNSKEVAKAAKYVVGGKPGMNFSQIEKIMPQGMKISVADIKVDVKGDKATATLQVTMEMPKEKAHAQTESVDLVRVDNDWLIVPSSQLGGGKEILAGLALMTTIDVSETFLRAKEAAKKTVCLSNIKQLALGVMMYLTDNDDRFTMNPSKLKATLHPYVKNDTLWYCPNASKDKAAYSINANLLNKNANNIMDPASIVMLYEGTKGQLDFRHGGYAAVAFADGHAKMINAEMAKKLSWKP